MIIMVTGGRDYDDITVVREALGPYNEGFNILLSGGADGADWLAEQVWGGEFQRSYVVLPAPWDRVGRPAGPMRSIAQLAGNSIAPYGRLIPDVLIAFPGGKGTKGTVEEAKRRGIEVIHAG